VPISHDCAVVPAWSAAATFVVGVVIGVAACLAAVRSRRPASAVSEPAAEVAAASEPATEATAASEPITEATAASEPITEATAASEPTTGPAPSDQVERLEVEVEDVVAELERRYQGRKAEDTPEPAEAEGKARRRSRR
jgi:cytoskeletal protein RodZ